MEISISSDIKELIFENSSVVIPGLGSFTGSYKSATIDSVQGQLSPPSYEIIFNSNQVINDGVLMDYLKRKYGITGQDAQQKIENFTKEAFETFEKHEILIIPEVGRLYKDYTDKIRFLPENTNFNTSTFGMPTVQFYPVSRQKEEPISPSVTIPVAVAPPAEKQNSILAKLTAAEPAARPPFPESTEHISTPLIPDKPFTLGLPFEIKKLIPAIAVALALVLIFCIYLFNKDGKKNTTTANETKTNPKPKVQTAPPSVPNPPAPVVAETKPVQPKPQDIASEKYLENNPKKGATEGNNIIKPNVETIHETESSNSATIIVGGFGNKNNINRLKTWIKSQGFKVYERKSGVLTIIGAEVKYTDKKELNNQLKRFKTRYGNEVEIMK